MKWLVCTKQLRYWEINAWKYQRNYTAKQCNLSSFQSSWCNLTRVILFLKFTSPMLKLHKSHATTFSNRRPKLSKIAWILYLLRDWSSGVSESCWLVNIYVISSRVSICLCEIAFECQPANSDDGEHVIWDMCAGTYLGHSFLEICGDDRVAGQNYEWWIMSLFHDV